MHSSHPQMLNFEIRLAKYSKSGDNFEDEMLAIPLFLRETAVLRNFKKNRPATLNNLNRKKRKRSTRDAELKSI